jgi:succinyl-CoA synthetase beta subunit
LNLQEHHGKKILQDAQIKIQPFGVARNAEEAFEHAKRLGTFFIRILMLMVFNNLGGNEYVVKAQILAGGRGKG